MSNVPRSTLFEPKALPVFSEVQIEQIETAISQHLQNNLDAVEKLTQQNSPSWNTLVAPLEELDDTLSKAWSPIGHLNNTMNSDELRSAYNLSLIHISEPTRPY